MVTINLALNIGGGHGSPTGLSTARRTLVKSARTAEAASDRYGASQAWSFAARLEASTGQLHGAFKTYSRALEMARAHNGPTSLAMSSALVGLGDLLREWNDLDAAQDKLVQGVAIAKETMNYPAVVEGQINLARVAQAQGRSSEAMQLLDDAAEFARDQRLEPIALRAESYAARWHRS